MADPTIEEVAESVARRIEKFARGVKISLFSSVIRDTRVDTGRLRGNWQTTTAAPAQNEIDRLDQSGSQAEAEVQREVKADTEDFLTNNVPYAAVWEDRDGMIARNAARITQILQRQRNI